MRTTFTRRTCPAANRDSSAWPTIDFGLLEDAERARAEKYKLLIEHYIDGGVMGPLLRAMSASHHSVLEQFNRCIRTAPDGRIYGWRALVKHLHVEEYRLADREPNAPPRKSPVGEFADLLRRFPAVAIWLRDQIPGKAGKCPSREHRIKIKYLQRAWLSELQKLGLQRDEYPFNTRYGGYRSLVKHVKDVVSLHMYQGTRERYGANAALKLNVMNGHAQNIRAEAPFDVVQIDAHKCDFLGSIGIETPKGMRWVIISRVWVISVVDVFTRAVLGYSLAFSQEVNSDDVLRAIEDALGKHEKRALSTKGLQYELGSGYPSGEFSEVVGAGWALMLLDNALVHLSNAILDRARARVGCATNFGGIGRWFRRPDVERIFGTIESAGFSRLHSAVGNSPEDPLAKDSAKRALEAKLTVSTIQEMADTIIASYNGTVSEGNGFASPLQMFQFAVRENNPACLPMPVAITPTDLPLTVVREARVVSGNLRHGCRPHICVDRERYTNTLLAAAPQLIGKEIVLHIDEEHMRTMRAFLENGTDLGVLTAVGKWRLIDHTRRMRKEINSLIASKYMRLGSGEDPVTAYHRYLAEEALENAASKPHKISRAATKLARAGIKSGVDTSRAALPSAEPAQPVAVPPPAPVARHRRPLPPKAIY